ncbi:uncharacterized protein, partial [Heptranchias perlo]|uniref:uncharacterized protein n=1 Tax=Heptranchias perlo TaxID=212740 RepID=UPI0035593C11
MSSWRAGDAAAAIQALKSALGPDSTRGVEAAQAPRTPAASPPPNEGGFICRSRLQLRLHGDDARSRDLFPPRSKWPRDAQTGGSVFVYHVNPESGDVHRAARAVLKMAEYLASIFGTEKDKVNCSFYFKIGACRHGDRCSRLHNKPTFSQTILIQNIYRNPQNSAQTADGSHCAVGDVEMQEHYDEFFEVSDSSFLALCIANDGGRGLYGEHML